MTIDTLSSASDWREAAREELSVHATVCQLRFTEMNATTQVTDMTTTVTARPTTVLAATSSMAVNCSGAWGPWMASCTVTCGLGPIPRVFVVSTPAAHGGMACAFENETLGYQPCYPQACPKDCAGNWSQWTGCSASCGPGEQKRYFTVLQAAEAGRCKIDCNPFDHAAVVAVASFYVLLL